MVRRRLTGVRFVARTPNFGAAVAMSDVAPLWRRFSRDFPASMPGNSGADAGFPHESRHVDGLSCSVCLPVNQEVGGSNPPAPVTSPMCLRVRGFFVSACFAVISPLFSRPTLRFSVAKLRRFLHHRHHARIVRALVTAVHRWRLDQPPACMTSTGRFASSTWPCSTPTPVPRLDLPRLGAHSTRLPW